MDVSEVEEGDTRGQEDRVHRRCKRRNEKCIQYETSDTSQLRAAIHSLSNVFRLDTEAVPDDATNDLEDRKKVALESNRRRRSEVQNPSESKENVEHDGKIVCSVRGVSRRAQIGDPPTKLTRLTHPVLILEEAELASE